MKIRSWVLAALGLIAFAGLVWFAGPLLSIGGASPLASTSARIAVIALFALQYVAQKLWFARRARRRNERVVEQLSPAEDSAEAAELAQLRKRFAAALATLKHTRFGSRGGFWSSLSWKFGRPYLYQLPWYLMIGAPGAGKTTALLNSGLQFPLAGEFGRGSVKGVGGTRNCDWWFTDHAVLLDTAGRYTTHETHRAADRTAWEGFLELLKRARPRQPLNGALVTVSVTDLLVFDEIQRAQHAATLRARVDEIRAVTGIRLPVYLLLTKCDLLPGFLDSFLAFDKRARDQVWGTTFDFSASTKGRAPDQFAPAFDQLVDRLHADLVQRMQAERDPQRRARIYSFPRHFNSLKEPLNDLVRRAFGAGTSSAVDGAPCLRGVYFTSGTQEGTPIDRALSALGRELGLGQHILPPNQSTGKSFFLAGLLRGVVFPEAEIAGRSPRLQRWRTRAITALVVSVQVAGALLAAYWATSYSRSSAEIEQLAHNVAGTKSQIQAAEVRPGSDPRPLLPLLNALQDLTGATSATADEPATPLAGFREHQRLKLAAAARVAYERNLQDSLLPRILQRCEEQMRSGLDSNLQYEALKAYTMMHETAHFDPPSLKAFAMYDWDTTLEPVLSSEDRGQLAQHLDALLEAGAVGATTAMDPRLVASVRARLASQPVAQRIATRLKAVLGARSYPEFAVASLGAPAAALFVGKDGHSPPRSVPGRYTLEAYRDGVLTTLPLVPSQLTAEATWVLSGSSPRAPGAAESGAAGRAVAEALASYLDGYERTWASFVDDLRLRPASSDNDAIGQAQVLAARDGPLAVLLRAVVQQTSLRDASAPSALGDAAAPLEHLVEDRFAQLRGLTQQAPDGRRPLDLALVDFNEVHVLRALVASNRGDSSETSLRLERIRADSRHFPEPVRSMLLAVASPMQDTSGTDTAAKTPSPPPLTR